MPGTITRAEVLQEIDLVLAALGKYHHETGGDVELTVRPDGTVSLTAVSEAGRLFEQVAVFGSMDELRLFMERHGEVQ